MWCATLFAQSNVSINVNIIGLDKPLEDNVRLFLSIEQQKDHDLLSEGRLQRLHKKAFRKYQMHCSRLATTNL
jgi:5,10-methylene-tetrahydrofolate dehydrogenase/methenyl tetrahydrofolate cyclohydrolase